LAAGLLFILPAFLILGALSELYLSYHHLPVVAQVLLGAKAVVVAIILQAAWKLSRKAIRHWSHLLIAVGAWAALQTGGIPFPLIILGAGLLGFFHQSKKTPSLSSVVVRPSPSPVLWIGFALVWGLPFLFLSGILQTVALFFTKLALVTFGGAYAVLPYLQQEATEHYHWLSAGQMMDGLALGETTPGPLIMIVTYVGFWAQGWPGAATATYYTFLPSFFFILVGAPYIERWANLFWLERALQGITAAVIGFICALGFFFALHLFWIDHTFQGFPFTLSLIAWALLSKWNLNILSLVLGGGLLGWLWPTVISCFF
jgi:chromate transporter